MFPPSNECVCYLLRLYIHASLKQGLRCLSVASSSFASLKVLNEEYVTRFILPLSSNLTSENPSF